MKSIKKYKPIDFDSWDVSGTGKNIRDLFKPIEAEIWYRALPYQDKRDDVGHTELVVYFAFKLLGYIKTERAIVIPAAILHDTGWSGVPEVRHNYDPYSEEFRKNEPEYRNRHQRAGVVISQRTLEEVHYAKKYVPAILKIIAQHDTRDGFFCTEDGVVRDADKLWRFTLRQSQMPYMAKKNPENIYKERMRDIQNPSLLYSDISRHIARVELEKTMSYLMKKT